MADQQGLICWDDIATAFQISHQPTTRSTYGSAQITPMLAVGLLSPGTLQTQVWCLFDYFSIASSFLIIYFIINYMFRQSMHILYVKLTVFIGVFFLFTCPFIYPPLSVLCVFTWACAYAFMHKCRSLLLVLTSHTHAHRIYPHYRGVYVSIFFPLS